MRHDETGRSEQLLAAARANQEELVADLERLVRIPSVAAEGFPAERCWRRPRRCGRCWRASA